MQSIDISIKGYGDTKVLTGRKLLTEPQNNAMKMQTELYTFFRSQIKCNFKNLG